MTDRPGICKHGGLRRCCETCDLADEVDRLTAENEWLREALNAAPHVEVYDQTIRYDFQWPQYAKWYTETRLAALNPKEKP